MKLYDWVLVLVETPWRIYQIVGTIELIRQDSVYVRKVYSLEGNKKVYYTEPIVRKYCIDQIIKIENQIRNEDMQELINLALDTGDEEWFRELSGQLVTC